MIYGVAIIKRHQRKIFSLEKNPLSTIKNIGLGELNGTNSIF
jgi:hypothetical protein